MHAWSTRILHTTHWWVVGGRFRGRRRKTQSRIGPARPWDGTWRAGWGRPCGRRRTIQSRVGPARPWDDWEGMALRSPPQDTKQDRTSTSVGRHFVGRERAHNFCQHSFRVLFPLFEAGEVKVLGLAVTIAKPTKSWDRRLLGRRDWDGNGWQCRTTEGEIRHCKLVSDSRSGHFTPFRKHIPRTELVDCCRSCRQSLKACSCPIPWRRMTVTVTNRCWQTIWFALPAVAYLTL